MRTTLISIMFVFSSGSAFALTDAVTAQKTAELKLSLGAEKDKTKRLELLEAFKDFIFERLQKIDVPESETQRANFAELNEFESSVFMFRFTSINTASCRKNWRKVTNANSIKVDYNDISEIKVGSPTKDALEILKLICK